jgi:hypothetical protein
LKQASYCMLKKVTYSVSLFLRQREKNRMAR